MWRRVVRYNFIDVSEECRASIVLASCFLPAYFSTLKTKAVLVRSSETSVKFYRSTWRYIREDGKLYSHLCENLKYVGNWRSS
jgi:hypothetical protein